MLHFAGFDCIMHQHSNSHWPHSSRHRSNQSRFFTYLGKLNITDQAITAFRISIIHPVDTYINNRCPFFRCRST